MYPTSKDYGRLYELAMAGEKIPCWLDYWRGDGIRDIAEVKCRNGQVNAGVRGICYTDGITKEAFIKQCEQLNLEFIEPGPRVSAKALDALDTAIERADRLSVSPAIIDPRRVGQLEKLLKENEAIRDGLKEIKAALELKKEKESEAK